MIRNPKQEGSNIFDCVPQSGSCPNNCNQCYFNRGFYRETPFFPTLEEVGDGIVRVNSGHDSNIDRDFVISSTAHYPKRFFNTSIPRLDFPAPVVLTANPNEETNINTVYPQYLHHAQWKKNLMFVRIRVGPRNIFSALKLVKEWTHIDVPVIFTFMRYFDACPDEKYYTWRKSIINEYWCATTEFQDIIITVARLIGKKDLIIKETRYCRDCGCCEKFYYQAMERMNESKIQ